MENNTKIKELAKKYKLTKDDFWNLTGNVWIIKHDAVEKIAKIENIIFENPTIVEHSREHCVLMGTASIWGKNKKPPQLNGEWSFGEADLKLNCKNKYPYAMAEKRLKDRLTLKLINAYEYGIYSDQEADDFKKEDNSASGKQQEYVYQLFNHTAFKVGNGSLFKDEWEPHLLDIFQSSKRTSDMITDMKKIIDEFKDNQKKGKLI